MKALFKGTTAECLAHFAKRADCIELMQQMLPGVHIRTIERWVKEEKNEPVGEYLFCVRVILTALGYEVAEFASLDPTIQDACKMFAFGLVSIDDLASEVGYQAKTARTQLFAVLHGKGGLSPERQQRVKELTQTFETMIEEAEQAFRAKFSPTSAKSPEPVGLLARAPSTSSDVEKKALLDALARLVMAVVPLAERVLTDDYTPEDREYVRAQAGGNGVFKAANALYRLCGERARTTIHSSSNEAEGGAR
jgi:hypothetical protein